MCYESQRFFLKCLRNYLSFPHAGIPKETEVTRLTWERSLIHPLQREENLHISRCKIPVTII